MRMNTSALSAPAEQASVGIEVGRHARLSKDGFGIVIDGAVACSLRLIPSNKILGLFASARDVWPAVIAAVDAADPRARSSSTGTARTDPAVRYRAASRSNTSLDPGSACPPSTCARPTSADAEPEPGSPAIRSTHLAEPVKRRHAAPLPCCIP